MRRAAALPVSGPASTDVLAAGGGLEMPGRERAGAADAATVEQGAHAGTQEIIPGAREADTQTHREAGAIGGQFSGMDLPPSDAGSLDDRTAAEHLREGGDTGAGRRGR